MAMIHGHCPGEGWPLDVTSPSRYITRGNEMTNEETQVDEQHEGMYYDMWSGEWLPEEPKIVPVQADSPLHTGTQNGDFKSPAQLRSELFRKGRQEIYGENTMLHGSTVFPKEYGRFRWACNLTGQQYSVLITLMLANSLENEKAHKPTYISQKEVGAQLGVTAGAICQIYGRLEDKKFVCPFCKFKVKGYIRREKVPFKDGELQSDLVWTDGFKNIINHLAGHYNEYMAEFGYEGKKRFKQDRDAIIAGNVKEWRKERGRYAWEHRDDSDF